jgi:septum formation protein
MIQSSSPIILASQSPRRKQLLEWAEVPFTVVVSNVDESYPADLSAADIAVYIAHNKAQAVKQIVNQGSIIIAADTIVVIEEEILGKPIDKADAIQMLTKLAGKTHHVITGVTITQNEKTISFADTSEVLFNPLSTQQIEHYIEHYQPYDKAGSYAIQEWIGVIGIKKITGDFYNIMGLPVSKVVQHLQDFI